MEFFGCISMIILEYVMAEALIQGREPGVVTDFLGLYTNNERVSLIVRRRIKEAN